MAKRKTAQQEEKLPEFVIDPGPEAASQPAGERQPGDEPPEASPAASSPTASYAPVQAPPKGEGRAYTIDNRVGYRKEDTPDGRKRQIRFAEREGGVRPDDELLEPVRKQKPNISWASQEKSWKARKNPDGLEAIDSADQELREIGRNRAGVPER
jgi:hypothetical protein